MKVGDLHGMLLRCERSEFDIPASKYIQTQPYANLGACVLTMTIDKPQLYGAKVDRLLRIQKIKALNGLILPIFAIPPLPTAMTGDLSDTDDAILIYGAAMEKTYAQLAKSVEDVCGPAPWIVRSSGDEDLIDHINAGGYESLICHSSQTLMQDIAAVALSGTTEHARRQLALSGRKLPQQPIACFVQPLLNVDVSENVQRGQSPYLETDVLNQMEAVCSELMEIFDFMAIDCEWGLETSLGFVSVTTVMPRNSQLMNVAHTIGFGFASAQNTGSLATTLSLRPACSNIRLWRGRHLRMTTVHRLHLLQVRPAYLDEAFREREALSDACREVLAGRYDVLPASLMQLGARSWGRAMVSPDLMSAWRRYLALTAQEQADVAVVLVDEGNAQEHAGIMFRQQNVTCVTTDTRRLPAGADCVIFDQGACIFGDSTMLRSIQSEVHRELVLPDDCALIFTDEVLAHGGELLQSCSEALVQLRGLPVAKEVQRRLITRTVQPTPKLWLQDADAVVLSPSLLTAIWRSGNPGYTGEYRAASQFARRYECALRLMRDASQREFRGLHATSAMTSTLLSSGDVRVVMALLECEAATSWLPQPTLRRLIHAAAVKLAAYEADNAVLILESVRFVETECERLPLYLLEETVTYLEALAQDLENGLSVDALVSIRSLELPVASAVMLTRQAFDNPGLLESVSSFCRSLVAFKSVVWGCDARSDPTLLLNNAYLALRDALCLAGLEGIAEQIRGSLIEAYDASLKALLGRVADERDTGCYRRYVRGMQGWIEFLKSSCVSERDSAVLQRFEIWLRQWNVETMPESFEIRDRNWRLEFSVIDYSRETMQRYENPHVLHNLLHQYALAGLRLESLGLPQRVQALEHFCSTFSSRATKILRFERELLEIQIPMGTHKASYVFTPGRISVEWTEPPDCPESEIARILAFEVFLDRFRLWAFPGLTFRREQVQGTWTLIIRLNAQGSQSWDYEHLRRFVVTTRFLFDASYDFSYVANETVEGLGECFHGQAWKAIFTTLLMHRALLTDASQYVALHALPMSSTVGTLARSRVIRGLFLRCSRRGFAYCRGLIDAYAHWLTQTSEQSGQWSERYEILRQASLFLAAAWSKEALEALTGRSVFNAGDDLIAACLFKRSDMATDLLKAVVSAPLTLSGIQGMIVRHAPTIAVLGWGATALAAEVNGAGYRFRRARHLLIARFGDQLEQHILESLIRHMDTVPWGHTTKAEDAIHTLLVKHGPVRRFELEKGMDWTTLAAPIR